MHDNDYISSIERHKARKIGGALRLTGTDHFTVSGNFFGIPSCLLWTIWLPTIDTNYLLYASTGMTIEVKADNSLVVTSNRGGVLTFTNTYSAAQLLALNIGGNDANGNPRGLYPGIQLAFGSSYYTGAGGPPVVYILDFWLNGQDLLADATKYTQVMTAAGYRSTAYSAIGSTTTSGYASDFSACNGMVILDVTVGNDFARFFPFDYKIYWNQGRGCTTGIIRSYFVAGLLKTPTGSFVLATSSYSRTGFRQQVRGGMPFTEGFRRAGSLYPPLTGNSYYNLAGSDRLGKRVGATYLPPATSPDVSTQLKDYIFENCQNYIRLPSPLTGVFSQWNGNTEMPQSLTDDLDIGYHKWGSTVAGSTPDSSNTTLSVITNSKLFNFFATSQSPAGFDDVSYEVALAEIGTINFYGSRKSRIMISVKAGIASTVAAALYVGGNKLVQTFYSLFDPSVFKPAVLEVSYNPNLSGPLRFSSNMVELYGYNCFALTGTIPSVPATLRSLLLNNCTNLTGYPADFNQVTTLEIGGTSLDGTLKAYKAITIDMSNKPAGNSVVDVSGSTYMARYNGIAGRVSQFIIPTDPAARIMESYLSTTGSGSPVYDFSARTTVLYPAAGNVPVFQCEGLQNVVWPLGKVIASIYVTLSNTGLDEAHLNATIDCMMENVAGYAGPYAGTNVLKSLAISGMATGASISNGAAAPNIFIQSANNTAYQSGRADRLDALRQFIEDYNWVVAVPVAGSSTANKFTRIMATYVVPGQPNWVVIESSGYNLIAPYVGRISNTDTLNTTTHTNQGRGGTLQDAIDRATQTGTAAGGVLGKFAAGYFYVISIPGLDTSTGFTSQTGVLETRTTL